MKQIIVIRHGEKAGDKLTPGGIEACIALAERIGTINRAYASERHRTVQTAELVSKLPVEVDARANVPGFRDSDLESLTEAQAVHLLGIIGAIWQHDSQIAHVRAAGRRMQGLIDEIMGDLVDGERALVVSHDGTMVGLEKILKDEAFDAVDHSFGPLEGFSIDQHMNIRSFR